MKYQVLVLDAAAAPHVDNAGMEAEALRDCAEVTGVGGGVRSVPDHPVALGPSALHPLDDQHPRADRVLEDHDVAHAGAPVPTGDDPVAVVQRGLHRGTGDGQVAESAHWRSVAHAPMR